MDLRTTEEIEKSCSVANQYRKSLYSNTKYEYLMKDLGVMPSISPCDGSFSNEVKIWRISDMDEDRNPICVRSFQLFSDASPEIITALAVSEENELIALGCKSGSVYCLKV